MDTLQNKKNKVKKTALIFDLGGVLIGNFSRIFWPEICNESGVDLEKLYTIYKESISAALWSGKISEQEFWNWLKTQIPDLNTIKAKQTLLGCLTPLPAFGKLSDWEKIHELHIISNHRNEWIEPVIEPVRHLFSSITISSEAGCIKPEAEIFNYMKDRIKASEAIFIDDTIQNVHAARTQGWQGILAKPDQAWIQQVDAIK